MRPYLKPNQPRKEGKRKERKKDERKKGMERGRKKGRKEIKSQNTHIIEKISIKLMKVINGVRPLFKSPESANKLGAG